MIIIILSLFFVFLARLLKFPISNTSKKHKNENENNNNEINNNDENDSQNLKEDRTFQIRQNSSSLDEKIGLTVSQLFGRRYYNLHENKFFLL